MDLDAQIRKFRVSADCNRSTLRYAIYLRSLRKHDRNHMQINENLHLLGVCLQFWPSERSGKGASTREIAQRELRTSQTRAFFP